MCEYYKQLIKRKQMETHYSTCVSSVKIKTTTVNMNLMYAAYYFKWDPSTHPADRQETWIHYTYDADMKAHSWWIKYTACSVCCCSDTILIAYGDGELRDAEVSVGAQWSRASHRDQHRCVIVCSGTIKLHNMRYLHYRGSISMSWRSLLLIQMAEECVRISKHGEIIDHLNL